MDLIYFYKFKIFFNCIIYSNNLYLIAIFVPTNNIKRQMDIKYLLKCSKNLQIPYTQINYRWPTKSDWKKTKSNNECLFRLNTHISIFCSGSRCLDDDLWIALNTIHPLGYRSYWRKRNVEEKKCMNQEGREDRPKEKEKCIK